MTLKEIAAQANVSISTVSRVLNASQPNAASPQVQALIWEIARKGGYTPNEAAKALRKTAKSPAAKNTQIIYCMIACHPEEVYNDPFFTQAMASIEQEAFRNGFTLEYTFLKDQDTQSSFNHLNKSSHNPLIVIGRFEQDLYQQLRKYFKKIVYLGWNDLNLNCDSVICDGYQAAQEAVKYLYQLGHRRIGFFGTFRTEARFRGYVQGLQNLGLEYYEDDVVTGPTLSYELGYRAMESLIEKGLKATAIYCANDTTAIGALRACKTHNLRVPEDISIMGSNDIEPAQYISPMLTTIHIPLDEMGKVATKTLIDRINGGHSLPLKIFVPFQLVKRESCTSPRL